MTAHDWTFQTSLGDATIEAVQMADQTLMFANPGHIEVGMDDIVVRSKEGTEYFGCYVTEVTENVVRVAVA